MSSTSMAADPWARVTLRRLRWRLVLLWSIAWVLGVGALFAIALFEGSSRRRDQLRAELAQRGVAAYELAWFDADGRFHGDMLIREPLLLEGGFQLWVLDDDGRVLVRPARPRLTDADARALVEPVVAARSEEAWLDDDGVAAYAAPLFSEPEDAVAGAVLISADSRLVDAETRAFARELAALASVLALGGIGLGMVLTRRSLRPVAVTFEQRERFLSAAAHELRTPVATLRAICESALAGDESAERALQRVAGTVEHTQRTVEDLLLFAKLDSGAVELQLEPVRLDLLVESALDKLDLEPEVSLALPAVTVDVDVGLVEVALANLLRNAVDHGGGVRSIVLEDRAARIRDAGPGFPPRLIQDGPTPFGAGADSHGAGVGLSLVALIAQLHGGELQLRNASSGGGEAVLRLRT